MKEEVIRTVQHFTVVVETTNGEADSKMLASWVQDRVLNATRSPRPGQFIAIGAVDKTGTQVIRTATHGTPHGDSHEIVEDLFDTEGNT